MFFYVLNLFFDKYCTTTPLIFIMSADCMTDEDYAKIENYVVENNIVKVEDVKKDVIDVLDLEHNAYLADQALEEM